MKRIIEEGLGQLKSRIDEIVERFEDDGLSPQSLSEFERGLQAALGELGRCVEKAVLEAADVEERWIDEGGMRHYWK